MSLILPQSFWMRRLWVILSIVALDSLTKHWVLQNMLYGESRPITSFFYLTYVRNTGSAFGLFQDSNMALLALAFIILGVLAYSAKSLVEQTGRWGYWALPLIVGGAIGNILDRLQYGYVVDFFDFRIWPVFNIADSAISVGTVLLALGMLRAKR